jgi:hypothetical protein
MVRGNGASAITMATTTIATRAVAPRVGPELARFRGVIVESPVTERRQD